MSVALPLMRGVCWRGLGMTTAAGIDRRYLPEPKKKRGVDGDSGP